MSFPKIIQQVGDHPDFVQEELLGLHHWTKVWAICVVMDVCMLLGHSDFGIFSNVGACSISCVSFFCCCIGCFVLHNLVNMQVARFDMQTNVAE